MRIKNADGSISETCAKCEGSGFRSPLHEDGPGNCSECGGKGVKTIAPAGSVVTDESPAVVVTTKSIGGGIALHPHVIKIPQQGSVVPPGEPQINKLPVPASEHLTPPFPTAVFTQETHGIDNHGVSTSNPSASPSPAIIRVKYSAV